ncbi:hypothetical protein DFH05DRAFT_244739 [Lentinula detonsa]|uniref:Uncharacterized protein n=1 Tax=Lentinula detonsa TaxID=2804962 RepID=A0A9W8NVH6_9AGAR|nr:hypothetical protein DFH05DRAFT_244739 [Lentinula detonsa]
MHRMLFRVTFLQFSVVLSFLFLLETLVSNAAPTSHLLKIDQNSLSNPDSHPASSSTSQCPSSSFIARYVEEHFSIGNNTLFYSSPITTQIALDFAKVTSSPKLFPELPKFVVIRDDFPVLNTWRLMCGGTQSSKLVPRLSKAMALASKHKAYVLVGKNSPPRHTSIWWLDELPTLQRNAEVDEILEVEWEVEMKLELGDVEKAVRRAKNIWTAKNSHLLPESKADA